MRRPQIEDFSSEDDSVVPDWPAFASALSKYANYLEGTHRANITDRKTERMDRENVKAMLRHVGDSEIQSPRFYRISQCLQDGMALLAVAPLDSPELPELVTLLAKVYQAEVKELEKK